MAHGGQGVIQPAAALCRQPHGLGAAIIPRGGPRYQAPVFHARHHLGQCGAIDPGHPYEIGLTGALGLCNCGQKYALAQGDPVAEFR